MKKMFGFCLVVLFLIIPIFLVSGCASNSGPPEQNNNNPDPQPDPLPPPDPSISIFINQVETECIAPDGNEISAYVSVVDELGNPIDTLELINFQVTENLTPLAAGDISFAHIEDAISDPISFVIIMDYSNSITRDPERQAAMEDAVKRFIDLMQPNDQAEIIKFNSGIRYIQPFTSDKSVLEAAVDEEVDLGATYLYDTLYSGIEDVGLQSGRKAVIAITDGREEHTSNFPGDGRDQQAVIELAQNNNIPLFLIGLGPEIEVEVLGTMAEDTSGHYYQAATNNDLQDIYTNIAALLNVGRYLFRFDTLPGSESSGNLSITVTNENLEDSASATFAYTACP
jgi:VWFA-related protein